MMDGVSFHEMGKDAFGKPVERKRTKRLYPAQETSSDHGRGRGHGKTFQGSMDWRRDDAVLTYC